MYDETVVIYSDILFTINFSLDFLCLFISGRVLNRAQKPLRLVGAAVIGGLYSFIPYLIELPTLISLPLNLLSVMIMCLIGFGKDELSKFLIICGTFIVSSALMGGLITALYNLSHRYSNGVYSEMSATVFALISLFSVVITLSYGLICKRKIYTHSASIRIYLQNTKIDCSLLCDSGNLVTEPFSSLPVIIISNSCLPTPYCDPESDTFPFPIRVIPFSTSAGRSCFLGFRPEKIELIKPFNKNIKIDAFIGIDTSNTSYSGYDGLIPTCIL